MTERKQILIFVACTWGVIIGLPLIAFIILRAWISDAVSALIALALFATGVVFGEWLARAVNALMARYGMEHRDRSRPPRS